LILWALFFIILWLGSVYLLTNVWPKLVLVDGILAGTSIVAMAIFLFYRKYFSLEALEKKNEMLKAEKERMLKLLAEMEKKK